MKNPEPGYPLPAGELGEDEIVCQLVYLPDRPEYWQALFGALHYMTTWRAWERDDDKRGKDAASNWREAFEMTVGCWRMTCLEQLQQDVSDILAQLRNTDFCCSDTITYGDQTAYETEIIPGDEDPPDHYGETEVEDWEEWKEYLCHNANLWVDELVRAAETFDVALETGGISIGLIAAAIAAIGFFVVGGLLALPLLMTVLFGMTIALGATIFADAAIDIEDARGSIVCAIISGRSVSDAVEDALSSGVVWDVLFAHMPYESAVAVLYEGGQNGVYLEAELDDSCECLCPHFTSINETDNPVVYQSAAGAQFQMTIHEEFGYDTIIAGSFSFNKIVGDGFCAGHKVIDSIVVNDGLDFTALAYWDPEKTEWGPDDPQACNYDITLLEDVACSTFWIHRNTPAYDGCAVGTITVTITYHDVIV